MTKGRRRDGDIKTEDGLLKDPFPSRDIYAIFKNPDVTTVVVYASAPTSRVIGEFEISSILSDSPQQLWQATKRHAGVDETFTERSRYET